MTKSKELFTTRPQNGNSVQMYVCGVTVYDYSHIGHARVYVAFDVLYRLLMRLGYEVQYVRNFTDIDDKIIKRANEAGEDPLQLSARFIEEFTKDMDALHCLRPTQEPRATQYVEAMVKTIQDIMTNGHAYKADDGDVFFDVVSLEGYGRLSGRTQEDNRAGERVAVDVRKRNPADFALWKSAKAGEPSWPSPWGPGRPGWHIECSAMIREVMGRVIDIHGGGRDLVFPHHENELAQCQAAVPCGCRGELHDGRDFVRYWVHNGFVNVDSEKMSKSLGNFFTIRDVLLRYHPLALRWFLLATHYRAAVNYSDRALDEASDRLYYVLQALQDATAELERAGSTAPAPPRPSPLMSEVMAALRDDLNTPAALAVLSAPLKAINDLLTTKGGKTQTDRLVLLAGHRSVLQSTLGLLGVLSCSPSQQQHSTPAAGEVAGEVAAVMAGLREKALVRAGLSEAEVQQQLELRAQARAAKDFGAADVLRRSLAERGILICDSPQGTTWRPGTAT